MKESIKTLKKPGWLKILKMLKSALLSALPSYFLLRGERKVKSIDIASFGNKNLLQLSD